MRKVAVTSLITLALAGFAAAQRPPAPKAKTQPRLSDAQIEAAIKAKFAASKISTNHFQVRVQNGVATLEGRTDVVQHKGTATRLAKNAGAIAVNNRIQVSEAARKKAADNLSEGRRRAQIKRGEPRSQPEAPPKK
jgi:BON domain-containing protein